MALHPAYSKFKFTEADEPYVRAFEASVRRAGWDQKQIDTAFEWYRDRFKPGMTPADAFSSFQTHAEHQGLSDVQIEGAGMWHDAVREHGVQAFTPVTSAEGDATRQKEIDALRADPNSEYYVGPKAAELQREELEILERQAAAPATPGQAPASGQPGANTQRMAQLNEMRADPNSEYYVGPNAQALQAEERGLIEGQSPAEDSQPTTGGQWEPKPSLAASGGTGSNMALIAQLNRRRLDQSDQPPNSPERDSTLRYLRP
jgi:hypothetical protein